MNEFIIALAPSIVSLLGIIITAAITNSLVKFRVGELEKKVEKHNNIIERVYKLETEVKDMKEGLK